MREVAPGGRNPHGIHGGERYIKIPTELYERAERIAKEFDMDMREFIQDAVRRRFNELEAITGEKRRLGGIRLYDEGKNEIIDLSIMQEGNELYLFCEKCQSRDCFHIDYIWLDKNLRRKLLKEAKARGLSIKP